MQIEVVDYAPTLLNDTATLNINNSDAEVGYSFVWRPETYCGNAEILELKKDGTAVSLDAITMDWSDGTTIRIRSNANAGLAAGNYTANVRVSVNVEEYKVGEGTYALNLTVVKEEPKVVIEPKGEINLTVPSQRECAVDILLDERLNDANNNLTFDTSDEVTAAFAEYFELYAVSGENADKIYFVKFKDSKINSSISFTAIAEQFDGATIQFKITDSVFTTPQTILAQAVFKIHVTKPALSIGNKGKVTVDVSDVENFKYGNNGIAYYYNFIDYTITEGFAFVTNDRGWVEPVIESKKQAYADKFAFVPITDAGALMVFAQPDTPKGTYKFTYTPKVKLVGEESETFSLNAQTFIVTVKGSSVKAKLSSNKLTMDKNYVNTNVQTKFLAVEKQLCDAIGLGYWVESYDNVAMNNSIKLEKAPKGVTAENCKLDVWTEYDNIFVGYRALDPSKDVYAVPGEYKFSIIPYYMMATNIDGENQYCQLALAPITFTVKVTDSLPKVSLEKKSITIDNNNLATRLFLKWNIKGNYNYMSTCMIDGPTPEEGGVRIYAEGDRIRILTEPQTLKGTYKYKLTPLLVLDSYWDEEQQKTVDNYASLEPITLTVKVTSSRPKVKLSSTKVTAFSKYPGYESEFGFYAPDESGCDITTNVGDVVEYIVIKPADVATQTLQNNENTSIHFSYGRNEHNMIVCFNAMPKTTTPAGTYKFNLYAQAYGSTLEPVKLTVTVKDTDPVLKLSANKATLLTNSESRVVLNLVDKEECVEYAQENTLYLVKEGGNYVLVSNSNTANAYARVYTAPNGAVTIEPCDKAEELTANATVKNVTYKQNVHLKGGVDYEAIYKLTFVFDVKTVQKAKLSAKSVTWSNVQGTSTNVILSVNDGSEVSEYFVEDLNTGEKKDVFEINTIGYSENITGGCVLAVNSVRGMDETPTGSYKYKITPYVGEKALESVLLEVKSVNVLPSIKLSTKKLSFNRLDTRAMGYQKVLFKNIDVPMEIDVQVTKGPKGVDLSEINFMPYGNYIDERDYSIMMGVHDSETPAGKYTVEITPYIWNREGRRIELPKQTIAVTVTSSKIKMTLQNTKMIIDIADYTNVDMFNSVVVSGANSELIHYVHWYEWKLTKKPKDAYDNIWIEDLMAGEHEVDMGDGNTQIVDFDGRDFRVCWSNWGDGDRWVDIVPGNYEFTLYPAAVDSMIDGVNFDTPDPIKLTVVIKNSAPTIKYGKTKATVNPIFGGEEFINYSLSNNNWYVYHVDTTMVQWPKNAGTLKNTLSVDFWGDRLVVRSSEKTPEGKYTFTLRAEVGRNGVIMPLKEQKFTITVKNQIPTAKVKNSKLTLNTNYAGNYDLYGDYENILGKKNQTKLVLNKQFGQSHFEPEAYTIKFKGKAKLKSDAAKIEWAFMENGTIAAGLSWTRVPAPGSYTFEITPAIRSEVTGQLITLKPVKLTVSVVNKPVKVTAKASGKIDLVDRENTGITYRLKLSDVTLDEIAEMNVIGPVEGEDYSWMFYTEYTEKSDEFVVKAWPEDDAILLANTNYNLRLEVRTFANKYYYIPIKIKPIQSKVTLATDTREVTLYKSAAYEYLPIVGVNATFGKTAKNTTLQTWYESYACNNQDFYVSPVYDMTGEVNSFRIAFASEEAKAKYKAGTVVNLTIYVPVSGQAAKSAGSVTVKVVIQN